MKQFAQRQTLTLTHYGRKSVSLRDNLVHLERRQALPRNREQESSMGAQRPKIPQVKLSVAGKTFDARARFITDRAEHKRVLAILHRKYWMFLPVMLTGRILMNRCLIPDYTGSFEVRFGS